MRLWLQTNQKDSFKSLRVCKLETQAKTKKCSKKESKVKDSFSKKCIVENNQSYILSPRIGPGRLLVRCWPVWMTDVSRSVYMCPLGGIQRVIHETEKFKKFKFPD